MIQPIPPAVRILPMDSTEEEFQGWSIPRVQTEFFLGQSDEDWHLLSPAHAGRYRFRSKAMDACPNTVVLFQFSSHIVASATLIWVERFLQPDEGIYNGAYWFQPESIRIFKPVDLQTIQRVWPKVSRLSQVQWMEALDAPSYLGFLRLLCGIAAPVLPC
jgi:hypothetical protein